MKYKCKRCLTDIQANAELCVWCYHEVWVQCYTCKGKGQVRNHKWASKDDAWMIGCPQCNKTGWRRQWDGKTIKQRPGTGKLSVPDSVSQNGKPFD